MGSVTRNLLKQFWINFFHYTTTRSDLFGVHEDSLIFFPQFLVLNLSLKVNHMLLLLQGLGSFIELDVGHLSHLTDCEFAVLADGASHLPLFIMKQSTINIYLSLSLLENFILYKHVLHHSVGSFELFLAPLFDSGIFFSTHGRTKLMDM